MAIKQIRTFEDICEAIREELQFSSSDSNRVSRVERDVNAILQEVAATKNWWWLNGSETLTLPAYISTGTVTVTAGSSTLTFTDAPSPSCRGYLFAVDGYQEIYRIESHAAGATTAKLDALFNGSTDSDATFKIWRDRIPLPTDCKETLAVYHDHHALTLNAKGLQEYRRIVALNPRCEGKPNYYYTGDFVDPSQTSSITSLPAVSTRSSAGAVKTLVFASGLPTSLVSSVSAGDPVRLRISGAGTPSYNGDILVSSISTTSATNDTLVYTGKGELQESTTADTSISVTQLDQEAEYDRYRELYVYPHLNNYRVALHVDYIKQVLPLSNDDDEPVIPIEDRMVLVYGALSRAWARERNPDEAARNYALYQQKLAKMAGKLQDTQEAPTFRVSREYLRGKRSIKRRSSFDDFGNVSGTGGASAPVVTGPPSTVAVFDSSGDIGGSSTVSTTELGYLDGVTSAIQTQIDAITTLASGKIYMGNGSNAATEVTPAGDVTIATDGTTAIAAGVIVDADINASAAITLSKLAALTASRAVVSDSSGVLSSSAITSTEVTYLDDNEPLTSVTLTDNTASATNVATWTAASFDSIFIDYTIKRSTTAFEAGRIYLTTDGTNAAIAQTGASIGSTGVTLTADVSGGSLRLRYTTTSTGSNATFKYKLNKWLS